MSRCVHEMLPGQCATCTGRDGGESAEQAQAKRLLDQPGVFASRYAGTCQNCRERFPIGTPIRTIAGVGWVGSCCLDENGEPL